MVEIKLGDKVKDKLTDLKGIVVGKCVYLYGCTQLGIQPRELEDGKLVDAQWIDEPQVELIKDNGVKKSPPIHGGIRSHPFK